MFEQTTNGMQQSGLISELNVYQRGGSILKWFTMYMNSKIQYYRAEAYALRVMKDKGLRADAVKALIVSHFVLPMAFQFAANGFEWDDEDQLRAMILGSLNGLFIMGNFLEYTLGRIFGAVPNRDLDFLPVETQLENIVQLSVDIEKAIDGGMSKKELVNLVNSSLRAMMVLGIPYGVGKRYYEGLVRLIDGKMEDVRELIWSQYMLGKRKRRGSYKRKPFNWSSKKGGISWR